MEKVEMGFDETDQIKTGKVVYIETIDKAISASNYHSVAEISQAERKLIRKIDLMIMPLICIVGFLQFMDKTAVAYGAVLGMIQDINLQGSQYSLLSSLFYVGYLCMQLPNGYLIQRFPIAKYLGINVSLWGLTLALIGMAKNFSQMGGLRFLLGFQEAAVYPCFQILINTFYRKQEIQTRMSVWIVVNGLAQAVGGFIGYGIGHMEGVGGYYAWQWVMFIFGAITGVVGIIVFFLLIDNPRSPRFHLTEEEKLIVEERLKDNGVKRHQDFKIDQVWEALRDPKTYLFFLCGTLNNFNNGVLNTFNTLIVQGIGFSGLNSILLNVPIGVVDAILILITVLLHRKTKDILFIAMGMNGIATLGLILMVSSTNIGARLSGLYFSYGYVSTFILMMTCISSNTYGYTKKLFTQAVFLIGYTTGSAVAPLFMTSDQAPRYIGGTIGCIASNSVLMVLLFLLRLFMLRMNRKKASNTDGTFIDPGEDITDLQYDKMVYKL